jgi:hypothetical protein
MKHIAILIGFLISIGSLHAQSGAQSTYKKTIIQEKSSSIPIMNRGDKVHSILDNSERIVRPGEIYEISLRYDYREYNYNLIDDVVVSYEIMSFMNLELTFFFVYNGFATVEFDLSVASDAPRMGNFLSL